MSECVSPWFAGLICDHLFDNCPNRARGEDELRRVGWWSVGGDDIDPHGTDVCGLCLHRHNRAAHQDPNPTATEEPR